MTTDLPPEAVEAAARAEAETVAARVYPEPYHAHMRQAYADAYERGYLAALPLLTVKPDRDTTRNDLRIIARRLIADERRRQIEQEGYTPEHDRRHGCAALARAGLAYLHGRADFWPWDADLWKPWTAVRDLIRAGALALAAQDVAPGYRVAFELQREAVERLAATLADAGAVLPGRTEAEVGAQYLREAADRLPMSNDDLIGGRDLRGWLRARADRIERGEA